MSVLAAIGVLALLVAVHELGHFLAARLQGIHVNRFAIGFGPILWKYQGPETEYSLRAIPLGGFVAFPDDDPDSEIPKNDPNLLRNRPVVDRAIVISAGVIANLIFAYMVLVAQSASMGIPAGFEFQPGVLVPQVLSPENPAGRAGLQAGDRILAAAGETYPAAESSIKELMVAIQGSPNQPLDLTVQRGDRQLSLTVVPEQGEDGQGRIGVQLAPNGKPVYEHPQNPIEILTYAANRFQNMVLQIVGGFVMLIANFGETASQVSGPIKIVEWGANIAQSDAGSLFPFAALISINLAIINILPLPALDGGQLAFLLVEAVRGKPLPQQVQENVMQTGIVLLIGLGIFLIVRDTTQLEWVQRLWQ
jgi:membrane-associated protease RseP (regulator of RpoE activity)